MRGRRRAITTTGECGWGNVGCVARRQTVEDCGRPCADPARRWLEPAFWLASSELLRVLCHAMLASADVNTWRLLRCCVMQRWMDNGCSGELPPPHTAHIEIDIYDFVYHSITQRWARLANRSAESLLVHRVEPSSCCKIARLICSCSRDTLHRARNGRGRARRVLVGEQSTVAGWAIRYVCNHTHFTCEYPDTWFELRLRHASRQTRAVSVVAVGCVGISNALWCC